MSLLTSFSDLYAVKYSEWASMDAIPEEETSMGFEVTFALSQPLPPIKYHEGPLQFLSKPQVSPQDYEKRLLTGT